MNKKFDTLYARDSFGKILQWNIEVCVNGSQIDIRKSYGELDGAQALRWQRDIQGKNLGKVNATNEYEQAVADAESAIRLKKKKGYVSIKELQQEQLPYKYDNYSEDAFLQEFLPKNRTDASGDVKPMKCQQYYRNKKDWTDPNGIVWNDRKYYYLTNPYVRKEKGAIITKFPCMAQPKINGLRATIKLIDNKVVIKSKEGKVFNIAHIEDFLNINNDIFEVNSLEDIVLDGELYIHGELLQDIGSAINKPNLNTPRVIFILFDLAIEDGCNIDRWKTIKEHILPKLEQHVNCPIQLIQTVRINNDSDAQIYTDKCIKQGYEGIILRQFKGMYAFGKRPQDLTKLKRAISAEFKIIDIVPQEKDRTKGQFTCITKDGLRFDVNPMGNDVYKKHILRHRETFIGKSLQCSFYEYTKDMKPFHIIENTVRDYE